MENLCEFRSTKGHIGYPTCFNNKAEIKIIIEYNEYDKDTLYLCKSCGEAIKKDAENHNYKVTAIKIKGK